MGSPRDPFLAPSRLGRDPYVKNHCTTLYSRTSNTNSKKAWQLIALIHSSNRY